MHRVCAWLAVGNTTIHVNDNTYMCLTIMFTFNIPYDFFHTRFEPNGSNNHHTQKTKQIAYVLHTNGWKCVPMSLKKKKMVCE